MKIEVYNKERKLICTCYDIIYKSEIIIVSKSIKYTNGVIYQDANEGVDFVLGESDYVLQDFGYNPCLI
mgnify:FL=1